MREESGFALVITLIISALLVALVTEFIQEVYVEASLGKSYADAQQASLMADTGVSGGIKLVQTVLAGQEYSCLQDRWASPIEMEDDRGSLRVDISEENAKLNLNSLVFPNGTLNEPYYDMAMRLCKNLKLPAELLDTLADWMDTNDEPRPGGAESSFYLSQPGAYQAKNAALDTFDELRLIKGFDEKTIIALNPFVTVYGDATSAQFSTININTAPPEILAVLDAGMDSTKVARILEYRKTTPLKSPAGVTGISGLETIGMRLQGKIGVKGTIFRIHSRARVNETTRIIEALVKIDGNQSSVLYWREL